MYSVRNTAEHDLRACLQKVKEYGYDGVELASLCGKTPQEYKGLLEEFGLTPISAHVSYQEMVNDINKVIADYKAVGCKYIAVPWLGEDDRLGGENGTEVLNNINRFAQIFAQEGITLLYHNHYFEFWDYNGEYVLDAMYRLAPNLQAQLDSCWIAVAGESPLEYIKKYKNRNPVLHLKDYFGTYGEKDFQFRPCGYGLQDMGKIITAAAENGVKWLVVEQDDPSMDKSELECAKLSIDYIRGKLL